MRQSAVYTEGQNLLLDLQLFQTAFLLERLVDESNSSLAEDRVRAKSIGIFFADERRWGKGEREEVGDDGLGGEVGDCMGGEAFGLVWGREDGQAVEEGCLESQRRNRGGIGESGDEKVYETKKESPRSC
jgi:hypothetical protein